MEWDEGTGLIVAALCVITAPLALGSEAGPQGPVRRHAQR
jgi:hypothetical protein